MLKKLRNNTFYYMFPIWPLFAQEPLPRVIKFTARHLHTQYSLRLRLEYDFERNLNLISLYNNLYPRGS